MDNSRNRIEKFVNYIESQGIVINLAKNKARGNKGLFKVFGSNFRIDISKDINESEILHVLVHEFTHYVHYKYDKSLKSLNFLLGDKEEEYLEDLIQLTVDSIPKTSIEPLFNEKEKINREIKLLSNSIKSEFPNFKISKSDKDF